MQKLKKTKMIKNFFLIFFSIMTTEIIFRFASKIKIFDIALLRVFLSSLFIAILISYLLSFVSKKVSKYIVSFIALFVSFYAFLQMGFNNFLGVYISINTKSQFGAVVDYIKDFFSSFLPIYYLAFIPFVLIVLYFVFLDKRISKLNSDKKFVLKQYGRYDNHIRLLATTICLFVIGFLYYGTLSADFMQNELQTVATKDLFKNPCVPSIAVNEFGVIAFGILDVKSTNTDTDDNIIYNINKVDNTNKSRTFDDSKWQQVMDEETNEIYQSINDYLINSEITDYNDYTGMFKDKNLIVIMMESVNEVFINKEYFPNFYKIYNDGWAFVNNYSPRNSCSTGNNEFSGMTSLYTIYNNCTANIYKNNQYGTSIFDLFNKSGYQTLSMHDYTEAYYYRSTIHKNLGSQEYYGVEKLNIPYRNEYRNWASDEDFMNSAMDIIESKNTEPYMLWLTTVSSHQPYRLSSIEGDKYLEDFADTNYPLDLKRFLSKLKMLDNAIGILLDRLEKNGTLDDTVLLFYGDHYPYGLSFSTLSTILDYDLRDYEVERTPLLIYNPSIDAKKYKQYTSFINITPTIANLFDLEYDPRLYMGSDLFSKEYDSLVVYADGSWKNEEAYYDASDGTIKYYKDKEYSVDKIREINNKVTLKMQMSNLIIKNNYYKYLNDKINSANVTLASLEE